jgi:hypothetical protein
MMPAFFRNRKKKACEKKGGEGETSVFKRFISKFQRMLKQNNKDTNLA